MQLDFQQFLMKLEKLTDLRPVPDKEFVETYIKAYYLTENDMEQFIKNHRVSWVGAALVEPREELGVQEKNQSELELRF